MPQRNYIVGVDGGASKTLAVIGDDYGNPIALGRAGSTNYHNVGVAATVREIRKAIHNAAEEAGIAHLRPRLAVCALAAIDSDRDFVSAVRFVKAAKIAERSYVTHDSVAALHASFGNQPGIIINAGTGSVAAGVNSNGKYVRIGGWGYLCGDEGSGFDIGRKALVAAFRATEGRSPHTTLESILRRKFQVKSLREAIPVLYGQGVDVDLVARLALTVSKAASSDRVCRQILRDAGIELAHQVYATAVKLGLTKKHFKIATTGGNFKSRILFSSFSKSIRQRCPRATIFRGSTEPAKGAYGLAVSLFRGEKCGLRAEIHP